jgi:peptidoglycan/xylan/chitin deacetylase (PgdA/CDA1 family)
MKCLRALLFFVLPLAVIFVSCAGRPALREEAPPEAAVPPEPEKVITKLDKAARRVKQNGREIKKYFELGEDGRIFVKAEIDGLKVSYDLEGPWDKAGLTVNFLIRDDDQDMGLQDSFVWKPGADNAGVLLSFDDDFSEAWTNNFDLFEAYGARVTFFVWGGFTPFCVHALEKGHDVGYHSKHHLDLRKQSRGVFMEETALPAEEFRNAGIPLGSFAFPYGFSEPWMHEILFKHFSVLRGYGVTYRLYSAREIRNGYIISKAIDNTVIKDDSYFKSYITMMLRTVKFLGNDYILPVTTHDISAKAAWGIAPERLEFFLKTARDLKLRFYLYSDFIDT